MMRSTAQLGKILRSKMGEEEVVKLEEGLLSSKLPGPPSSSAPSPYLRPPSSRALSLPELRLGILKFIRKITVPSFAIHWSVEVDP